MSYFAVTHRGQQLLQKEKMLKEEVEEMKMTLSSSEESRARASAQSKQMVRGRDSGSRADGRQMMIIS